MNAKAEPVVVGVDGTRASIRAVSWAMDEATMRGCPLHVVNAWNYEPLADWREVTAQQAEAESEALIDDAVRTASDGRTEFPQIVKRSVRGYAAEVLEKASEDAALLVVASHTDHRIRHVVLGATSQHVVRHARTPVAVIPVTDRDKAEVGINRRGTVIGVFSGLGEPLRAFVAGRGEAMTVLPIPPDTASSNASDINDRGEIVGGVVPPGSYTGRPVRWDRRGQVADLPILPESAYTSAMRINDHGTIIGSMSTVDGESHAVVWRVR